MRKIQKFQKSKAKTVCFNVRKKIALAADFEKAFHTALNVGNFAEKRRGDDVERM
ncbi:MAG: hypothetical protein L6V93_02660 [Clostridiales bacterium]|nr:MAG: hypothetical protein L6V93_02660 [Clostridiales bacterium]